MLADVGSDHGYLPIWLYLNSKIKKAYALDISENCVARIKSNLKKYNIAENIITPVLSNGLEWLENSGAISQITDITIAGMGGETIAGIIKNAGGVNLVLQPNSKSGFLTGFLRENGFEILRETTAEHKKRVYNIINAKK